MEAPLALTTSITLGGNLTADPEVRQTQDGTTVANVSIAVNNRVRNAVTKEWEDGEPAFWRAVAFGNLADRIAASLSRGDRVILYGNVRPTSWTDKNTGTKRTDKEILLEDIGPSLQFADARPTRVQQGARSAPPQGGDQWATPGSVGDDTPF